MRLVLKTGSDVYGLPSQETYLDSQGIHLDAAKIGIFSDISNFLLLFSFSGVKFKIKFVIMYPHMPVGLGYHLRMMELTEQREQRHGIYS